jgi:hypothetical protein
MEILSGPKDQQDAFEHLKMALTTNPILVFPDFSQPMLAK